VHLHVTLGVIRDQNAVVNQVWSRSYYISGMAVSPSVGYITRDILL